MTLTHHASLRSRQRSIPPLVTDLLRSYGRTFRRQGADLYFLDKKGRQRAESYLGTAAGLLSRYLNAYFVEADDGAVITVGYRRRRFRNP